MKKIHIILSFFILIIMIACQSEEELGGNVKVGYLRLQVNTITSTIDVETKAGNDPSLTITILKSDGTTVVKTIADHKTLTGEPIELEAGQYIINAASAGINAAESGFNTPYYFGTQTFTIKASEPTPVTVTCSLANVKVSVNFSSAVKEAFLSANVQISSDLSNVTARSFKMNEDKGSAYFPVGGLTATLVVVNKAGQTNTMTTRIPTTGEVKARYHYILNYTMESDDNTSGSVGGVTVTADDKEKWYKYEIPISSTPTTSLILKGTANAWSNFAYVEGIASFAGTFDASKLQFEYQKSGTSDWQIVTAEVVEGNEYKAKLSGLTPNTQYHYRLAYRNGSEEYVSGATGTFTTETQTPLYNGGFEYWNKSESIWYPNESGVSFWDSSNPGSAGMMGESYNVTTRESTIRHGGDYSAKLASKYVIIKFAAASMYTGKFGELVGTKGAKLNWGNSFNVRPTSLRGYFQYAPGIINNVEDNIPAKVEKGETVDLCSIYIVLTTKTFHVDNTKMDQFPVFANMGLSDGVVAYAELPISESVSTNGQWKEFNLQLKYRDLATKPTHIIIVCSSSKYGDYFTGSDSSVLYLDDFELVYGDNPATVE